MPDSLTRPGPASGEAAASRERYGQLSLAREGHVAVVEIDRPPHNHVTIQLMSDLADALEDVDRDAGLRAVVLASAGKSFSAGADFVTPGGFDSPDGDPTRALYAQAVRLFSAKTPIVAAIQGAAVGAGLGLALVGDFRVAAPEARFSANFVKLGFHPGFGLTHTLPRIVGAQRASLMFLTGRRVKAEEALDWGLVDQIEPLETVRQAAVALAREIAENAPLAVRATRATLRAGLAAAVRSQTEHEANEQAALRHTADFDEGVRAVAERRPGNFVGA